MVCLGMERKIRDEMARNAGLAKWGVGVVKHEQTRAAWGPGEMLVRWTGLTCPEVDLPRELPAVSG